MISLIQGRYNRNWSRVLRNCWDFDLIHGKRRVVVFGKNLIKFLFAFVYFLFLSSSKTRFDDSRKNEEPRFEDHGFFWLIAGLLFYDLYTLMYVFMRMFKIGKGCMNRNDVSGRNQNYRTRRLEYKFKWFEFLGPLCSIGSHVSIILSYFSRFCSIS